MKNWLIDNAAQIMLMLAAGYLAFVIALLVQS